MAPAQPELKKVRWPVPLDHEKTVDTGLLPHPLFPAEPSDARPSHLVPFGARMLTSLPSQYLDKRLFVQLNGSRKVIGVLRGYDVFLNIVLDEAVEEKDGGEKVKLGMVVR